VKLLIVLTLFAIVGSLGKALFAMSAGPGHSQQMVRALTLRVALSLALFVMLIVSWRLGLLQPQGLR
jgi:hypothetical protein